ncbi:hypothetical protein LAZ67_X003857 [Cordylochernes scorpioides]|uniref:Ig-like domain-containing protein n=1 Tax=Cordylochernes scorpioides TaxID=51811 RepID=A0ABY6LUF7_9ARAC|nr:hypothetical protein LAZ67_X003857 [Cordylochernes scorpioides]
MLIRRGIRLEDVEVPARVRRGQDAQLRCRYALDSGEYLYAVKWYRNGVEFYRYVAGTTSPRLFPLWGLRVDVGLLPLCDVY